MASSFHVENFGCRAARADGEAVAALLRREGAVDAHPSTADVVIVNTCSVTAEADREARAYIRRAHRDNPNARIIATGCYAQRAPEELGQLPGVAAVIGNSHKALTPATALELASASSQNRNAGPSSSASEHDFSRAERDAALKGHDFSRADNDPDRLGALAPAGNRENIITIPALLASTGKPLILSDDTFAHSFLEEALVTPGAQTRPNLKIQEGCSNRCSFCVIPQTRGNSRSLPADQVLRHIHHFVSSGGHELVLSGINLGRWGRDLHPTQSPIRTLATLIRTIFQQTQLHRLRLSSIEPMDWDADLIALMREFGGTRLARHAHLPLQSGSDSVLRRMHRRYRPWHYAEKVEELLRAAGPALTIGADVMVGFPGETDREFQESFDFIRSLPFGYLHLFPFSPRPGTRAWTLHAQNAVPAAAVAERMASLRALAAEKAGAHRAQFIHSEFEAITLHTPPALARKGRTTALTDNFLSVEIGSAFPANQLVRVQVIDLTQDNALLATPAYSAPPFSFLHSARVQPVPERAF